MRDQTLLIAHSADADGVASAALLLDALGERGRKVTLRLCDYDELVAVLEAAAHSSYGELVVADLVLRAAVVPDGLVDQLGTGRAFDLFDHHHLEPARLALLRTRCRTLGWSDDGRCTARIVLDQLGARGAEHRALADAAQGSDCSGSVPPDSEALGGALDRLLRPVSALAPEQIVELLVSGLRGEIAWRNDRGLVGELAAGYLRASTALAPDFASLCASCSIHPLAGPDGTLLRVACGLASDQLYMKEGLRALRANAVDADLHAVFFAGGVVMVAQSPTYRGSAPDVVAFVESRGGGGRGTVGGFRRPEPTTPDDYPAQRTALLQGLESCWRAGTSAC